MKRINANFACIIQRLLRNQKPPANSRRTTATIAYISLYIALCVVIGFLLLPVPNVELITLFIFLGGYLFGMAYGALIGGTASFIFSAFNPWGSGLALPLLLIAQVISRSITGFCGGILSRLLPQTVPRIIKILIFGLCGGLLTLLYHILVIPSTLELAGFSLEQLVALLKIGYLKLFAAILIIGGIGGIGIIFALLNIVTNALFFAVLTPTFIRVAEQFSFVREFNTKNSK